MDVKQGTALTILAEIAFPPMGYLGSLRDPDHRQIAEVLELADITHFGRFRYGETATLAVRLPVRIPFGPAPAHYPQV